jgi:tRNA(Ile)-lysidine synthetase-like protein
MVKSLINGTAGIEVERRMHQNRSKLHPDERVARKQILTARRRHLQPLWNTFEELLLPHLDGGLVLAVSGGPDSRILMEAMARWRQRDQGMILVASVDHGHRHAAREEARGVIARARILGFDGEPLHVSSKKSGEGQLRSLRYGSLFQFAAFHNCQSVVTAHHGSDQAEGLIMDLLGRGGGRHGAGMKHRTEFTNGTLLRPFLRLTKDDLSLARVALGVHDAISDPDDARGKNMRSRLRNGLMGSIKREDPRAELRLLRKSQLREEEEEAFALLAAAMPRERTPDEVHIPLDGTEVKAVLRRVIMEECARLSARDPRRSAPSLDALLVSLERDDGPKMFDLAGISVDVSKDRIRMVKRQPGHRLDSARKKTLKPDG